MPDVQRHILQRRDLIAAGAEGFRQVFDLNDISHSVPRKKKENRPCVKHTQGRLKNNRVTTLIRPFLTK
jgi:hypothetical protein